MACDKYAIIIAWNGREEIPVCFKKDQDYSVCGDYNIPFTYSLENLAKYTNEYRVNLVTESGFTRKVNGNDNEWFLPISDKSILESIVDPRGFMTEVTLININLPEDLVGIDDIKWQEIEMIADFIKERK